jgi:conjugative relaxase-like TrwC/TraI family protein
MLSVHTLKSSAQAAKYYQDGDYYTKEEQENRTSWFGKGAAALGLDGKVDPDVFKELLQGKLLDGTEMHKGYNIKGEETRRPGYDLTFSAAKSASILALNDPRILEAHNQAVIATLQHIETTIAARVKVQGVVENHLAKNMVAATFFHKVSRELDPQLHTHCVLLNMTEIEGKWRSIFGDNFYTHKKSLGLHYRVGFASRLHKIGYEIEQTDAKEGFFEIKGVPQEVLKLFSKRREEIEGVLKAQNLNPQQKMTMTLHKGTSFERTVNTVASSMANFITRERKKSNNIAELNEYWSQEIKLANFSMEELNKITQAAVTRGGLKQPDPKQEIVKAFSLAIEQVSSRHAVFTTRDLLFSVKALCVTSNPQDAWIEQQISEEIKSKNLIYVGEGKLTTKQAIALETTNLTLMQQERGTCSQILPIGAKTVCKWLLKENSERNALELMVAGRDRFMAIDGAAETAQMRVVKAFTKTTPHVTSYVVGAKLADAKQFAQGAGVERTSSINGFLSYTARLVEEKAKGILPNSHNSYIWFIHRSQLLSSKDVNLLEQHAIALDARVVFLGDHLRRSGPDAGAPYRYLLDNNIAQISLASSKLDGLTLLREQKCSKALTELINTGELKECIDNKVRMQQAVNWVMNNDGVLITQNNTDKQLANGEIRKAMLAKGLITGEPHKIPILIPISLSRTQKKTVASLQVGDLLRANNQAAGLDFGSYYKVHALEHQTNTVIVEDNAGKVQSIELTALSPHSYSVYRQQSRTIQTGDVLLWADRTPKKLQANEELTKAYGKVVSIENNKITLALANGAQCTLDVSQHNNQHLEYGYARNLTECSQKNFTNGALLLNSKSYPEITLSDLYTGLSAITQKKILFCDSAKNIEAKLIEQSGLVPHAYEANEVKFTPTLKEETFLHAKGKIESTLARHHELLNRIVPGINLEKKPLALPKTPEYTKAIHAMDFAIAKLAEREAVFELRELLDQAKKYDVSIDPSYIQAALEQAIKEGYIIQRNEQVVTKETYAMECACLKIQAQGENAVFRMLEKDHPLLAKIEQHTKLTVAQKQAIIMAVTSSDRINLVQGVAGVGKTTMLKEVKSIARNTGFELLGVANTASAKNNLAIKTTGEHYNLDDDRTFLEAGIASKTLASFIIQAERLIATDMKLAREIYKPNTVFVLDEASLVSVRDMFAFLNIVEQLDCRAIAIGDDRQNPPIEASFPFKLMLGKNNNVAVMNINTRLQSKEALSLMQDIYAIRLDDAFDKMVDRMVELPDRNERLQAMANYYLGASCNARQEMMPMLPLNEDRKVFNQLVREGLKKEGTLTGEELVTTVLVPKDLTQPERTYALSFAAGDLIKFNHQVSRLGINKGDYVEVTGQGDNKVILRDQHGNVIHWDPNKTVAPIKGGIEVYTAEERSIMVGDAIRWRRNDESRGIVNSETAQIVALKEHYATALLANGNSIELNLTKQNDQHWDHAYGATVYTVQGLDKRDPIGHGISSCPYNKEIAKVTNEEMIIIRGQGFAQVGKVVNTLTHDDKPAIIAIDRYGKEHLITNETVEVYGTDNKIPKISSLENFLVMATRGDNLIMFVDNIDNYKRCLELQQDVKRTALSLMLPEVSAKITEKVKIMTATVYGLADPEGLNQLQYNNGKVTANNITTTNTAINGLPLTNTINVPIPKILNFNAQKQKPKTPKIDLEELKRALENDVLGHVSKWKGEPSKKTGREARWGNKGSFSVVLSGPKIGTWADFESGAAGKDLISLYMHTFGLSKPEFVNAIQDLSREVSIDITNGERLNTPEKIKLQNKQKEERLAKEKEERADYINSVAKFYAKSTPIKGTLAEKYLRTFRGIKGELPTSFRFRTRCWHKELETHRPVLIVPGLDPTGKLQSLNRIYLNKDGSKLNEQFTDLTGKLKDATDKRTYGPTGGATVEINSKHKQSDITYVTEGVENALSIKEALPDAKIISSFGVGQLKNLHIEQGTKTIVLCADNDEINSNSKWSVLDAIQKWLGQGYQVKVALPFGKDPLAKYDFNDMLKEQGMKAIKNSISEAIVINKTSELGDKNTHLARDFLSLKERSFFQQNSSPINHQQIGGVER